MNARRAPIVAIGPLDRLARQTALMIFAGVAVGIAGREGFHAVAAASLASTRNLRETVMGAQQIRSEFDLPQVPAVTAVYRRVG